MSIIHRVYFRKIDYRLNPDTSIGSTSGYPDWLFLLSDWTKAGAPLNQVNYIYRQATGLSGYSWATLSIIYHRQILFLPIPRQVYPTAAARVWHHATIFVASKEACVGHSLQTFRKTRMPIPQRNHNHKAHAFYLPGVGTIHFTSLQHSAFL